MSDISAPAWILFFVASFASLGGSLALLKYRREHSKPNLRSGPRTSPVLRAQEKLKSHLDEYQLADYTRNGAFNVVGKRYIYRIKWDYDWVYAYYLDDLAPAYTFGYAPYTAPNGFPSADVMLSKKLAIEADEQRLLRQACIGPGGRWPPERLRKRYLPPEVLLLAMDAQAGS